MLILSFVGKRQTNDYASPEESNEGTSPVLVLSRKVGERLVVAGNITVEVLKIQGNRITLGLVAPPDVTILRGELIQSKVEPNKKEVVSQAASLLNAS